MEWNDLIRLWNHASIKVLDVRHHKMKLGDRLQSYRLPASGFLYTTMGSANVCLDGHLYKAERFHVLHGGKGMCLDIDRLEEDFDYYLIFYKALIPHPCRQEILSLIETNNPFHMQYGFAPQYPISLFRIVNVMAQEWQISHSLERFHVNTLFHQFVYEVFIQLQKQDVSLSKLDLAAQALRYIHNHYMEPITLEQLAQTLSYSAKNLSKVFKKETGHSLIDYVIQVRIDHAKELMKNTSATIQEIAESVGYSDRLYFTRIFKKVAGVSPGRYKDSLKNARSGANRLYRSSRLSIVPGRLRRYNVYRYDNHYQYKGESQLPMYKGLKLSMAATLLFCFALFMSACSTGTLNTNTTTVESKLTTKGEAAPSNKPQTEAQTRVITTIKGDIEIPSHPERIVVDLYLGSFIALNVKPIGTPELNLKNPYFSEALAGVENIGEYESVSLEKIIDLQPDMIVTGNEAAYEQYSKIAPTIVVPYGELKNTHEELTYFGKLLGKEAEAEAWLADYDQRIAAAKAKVENAIPSDAVFSVMQDWGGNTGVFGDNFGRGGQAVYQALGLKPPAKVAEQLMKEQIVEVSGEKLSDFAGDYIILTSDTLTLADLKTEPIWKLIDAVKNDRVYIWSKERSWYFDPIATLSQTEELANWLAGAK
ncbi:AraC family transcriptional regulator [Paenibacillus sp. FSL A5-0031]|uniref:AraC family transcriptional regulator n=1 Tax=Paenibacillus sp. FSL A5-0031 TaxID=1920420 RepID=UPI00096F68F7|nr:AraC family transcriptional regulator [Paenibacillus sp. FSL A5-0031]OME76312.1 AraC family transcriptional regulator [Paenibacillus sp. FSL A5-0031]